MKNILPSSVGFRLRRTEGAPSRLLSALELFAGEGMPFSKLELDTDYHSAIQSAWQKGCLEIFDDLVSPNLAGHTSCSNSVLDLSPLEPSSRWRWSRFALMYRESGDNLVLESARTGGKVAMHGSVAIRAYCELSRALTFEDLDRRVTDLRGNGAGFLFVLRATGIIVPFDENGDLEERDDLLAQWELHDMLFHTRSRLARADDRVMYRFRGRRAPQPALKSNSWEGKSLELPRVDLQALRVRDSSFTSVLEDRRSVRVGTTDQPISLEQVSEFLFRTARIRDVSTTSSGEFTTRPYPTGGACYELELYIAINNCRGLARGLYYYDAFRHALSTISAPTSGLNELLTEAWRASGQQYVPQVLVIIASRFQRVAWKYSGTAYATQLKDAGVLMQTMYLVATAMGLAPCALGTADATLFGRLTQLDLYREGSIGEFLLGVG